MPNDLITGVSAARDRFLNEFRRVYKLIGVYMVVTLACGGLDLIGLLIDIASMGSTENSQAYYAVVAWVFVCLDAYFFFWYYSLKFMFPPEVWNELKRFA